jgi:hypothetical protein
MVDFAFKRYLPPAPPSDLAEMPENLHGEKQKRGGSYPPSRNGFSRVKMAFLSIPLVRLFIEENVIALRQVRI